MLKWEKDPCTHEEDPVCYRAEVDDFTLFVSQEKEDGPWVPSILNSGYLAGSAKGAAFKSLEAGQIAAAQMLLAYFDEIRAKLVPAAEVRFVQISAVHHAVFGLTSDGRVFETTNNLEGTWRPVCMKVVP